MESGRALMNQSETGGGWWECFAYGPHPAACRSATPDMREGGIVADEASEVPRDEELQSLRCKLCATHFDT
jgi:hypothetical protein